MFTTNGRLHCKKRLFGVKQDVNSQGEAITCQGLCLNFAGAKILLSDIGPISLYPVTRLRLPIEDGNCKRFCHEES
jgi:hypothetical protein